VKNSRELNAYLANVAATAGWGAPGGDGAAVAVPRKLYRVSEIADHMGLTRQTLHNYATIGLITEERRTDGGHRLFDESVFARLALIQRLKRTHRLHEIRRMLDSGEPEKGAVPSSPAPSAGGRSLLARSQDLAALSHLADAAPPQTGNPATSLREGEVAEGPDVAVRETHEDAPMNREDKARTDEQAEI
jgi:DNA-binding transcriptional MerR regulator